VKPLAAREEWLRETLAGLGYELADLETSGGGLIRVFIDAPRGITVEDCARVSHHLSRAFAVEGVDYERLEVSSPGLDRRLKKAADFARFAGRRAEVRLRQPVNGRRNFLGTVRAVQGQRVELDFEGGQLAFELADMDRARLVPEL